MFWFCSYSSSVPLIPCYFLVQGLFILFRFCSCLSSLPLSLLCSSSRSPYIPFILSFSYLKVFSCFSSLFLFMVCSCYTAFVPIQPLFLYSIPLLPLVLLRFRSPSNYYYSKLCYLCLTYVFFLCCSASFCSLCFVLVHAQGSVPCVSSLILLVKVLFRVSSS
jgi:hypothetical protein